MNITLVQTDLHWEQKSANLERLTHAIEKAGTTDVIVLPEMFNTAFSNRSVELSEAMDGVSVHWMKEQARLRQSSITGSLMIKEGDAYFNRMIWVNPDGTMKHYDKRHLFRMASEHDHFQAGQERVIIDFKGWKILLQVCYDLRFPVWSRNRYENGNYEYDLALYVANWPSARHHAWTGLLQARAMENLSYCVGVNRVGIDANGLEYNGGSMAVDYLGNPLSTSSAEEKLVQIALNKEGLNDFRAKFPAGLDADSFEIT